MQVHCLGTAGYHPNQTRHTSCYFLPESGIVLDAGSGLFRLAPLVQTDRIDILLSHAHLDHVLGLTFLLDVMFQLEAENRPVKDVRIWGEKSKLESIRTHLFSELIFPVALDAQWNVIDESDSFTLDSGTRVRWRKQNHPGGSVAYSIEWPEGPDGGPPKKLVYATDTTGDISDEAAQWNHGADLLMHECYFRDSYQQWAEKTGHCWTSRLVEVVRVSSPKKTLITHVNPLETGSDPVEIESIRAQVAGEVMLAEDGAAVEF